MSSTTIELTPKILPLRHRVNVAESVKRRVTNEAFPPEISLHVLCGAPRGVASLQNSQLSIVFSLQPTSTTHKLVAKSLITSVRCLKLPPFRNLVYIESPLGISSNRQLLLSLSPLPYITSECDYDGRTHGRGS